MKNKLLRNVLISMCIIIFLIIGVYLAFGYYFKQRFMMNTWINDVYCTGMNVEEVNKELLQRSEAPFFTIKDIDGTVYELSRDVLGFTLNYTTQLQEVLKEQQANEWTAYLGKRTVKELTPEITLDSTSIQAAVSDLDFVKKELQNSPVVTIEQSEEGYYLKNTMQNRLHENVLYEYLNHILMEESFVLDGYRAGEYLIDLADADCYKDVEPNEAQLETLSRWEIIKEYVDCGIVYDMGDQQIALAGKIASSFLSVDASGQIIFDQNGQPVVNEDAIRFFINSLADEYNTWEEELTFLSTAGEEKTVPYVNYGTLIDTQKEMEYLKEAFAEKRSEIHIPTYEHEGYVRGRNDIGDTYIEVDMGNQKLYAYLDGELLVETDIVTGNLKKKTSTPEGVVYINKKQRNRTLRGPGYASFVKYWMPVKGGIGLHDASWRKKFGGEIYKTDGSHGCINIPKEVMPEIYEHFDVGTPVILFY